MKASKHLGESISLGLLLVVVCVSFVGYMFVQSGAL
jgi:hypothetical protein